MRKVNRVTKIDSYPLPWIDDTLDALNGAKYFTSLDLKSAFHQVRMDEKSKHLTTFVTHIGSYSFLRMPYGVINATTTFQKLMERRAYLFLLSTSINFVSFSGEKLVKFELCTILDLAKVANSVFCESSEFRFFHIFDNFCFFS